MDTSHFHPMTVHFPIALILTGFLLDVISMIRKKDDSYSKAGYYLMILGTLAAVTGYLTGEFFTGEFKGPAADLKETHELFAKIAMWTMIFATSLRIILTQLKKENGSLRWLIFGLYFIAVLSVSYAGLLGGQLVYNNMIPSP